MDTGVSSWLVASVALGGGTLNASCMHVYLYTYIVIHNTSRRCLSSSVPAPWTRNEAYTSHMLFCTDSHSVSPRRYTALSTILQLLLFAHCTSPSTLIRLLYVAQDIAFSYRLGTIATTPASHSYPQEPHHRIAIPNGYPPALTASLGHRLSSSRACGETCMVCVFGDHRSGNTYLRRRRLLVRMHVFGSRGVD